MADQYLRKTSLIVYGNPPSPSGTGLAVPDAPAVSSGDTAGNKLASQQPQSGTDQPGIELGALRVNFTVNAMDADVPPTAQIRVFNLAQSTVQKIQKEFQSVTLQAGYETGNFGVIFQGTIIRIRKGRKDHIDSFVDIMASNLDAIYNFGFVNKTLKAGASYKDQVNGIQQAVNNSAVAQGSAGATQQGLQYGNIPDSFGTGGTLPRGKVLFGLAREKLNNVADSTGSVWSIGPDGKVNFHALTGYLPGEAVVINAQTGMVDVPVATTQGIEVSCLLNPKIKPGTRIKLNNADITTTTNQTQGAGFPAYADFQFFANTSSDGIYVALVVEHEGDNRGHGSDWVTHIVALALDSSGSSGTGNVAAYG
jgi:hypothetical protein